MGYRLAVSPRPSTPVRGPNTGWRRVPGPDLRSTVTRAGHRMGQGGGVAFSAPHVFTATQTSTAGKAKAAAQPLAPATLIKLTNPLPPQPVIRWVAGGGHIGGGGSGPTPPGPVAPNGGQPAPVIPVPITGGPSSPTSAGAPPLSVPTDQGFTPFPMPADPGVSVGSDTASAPTTTDTSSAAAPTAPDGSPWPWLALIALGLGAIYVASH